jgi:hypothetical protein
MLKFASLICGLALAGRLCAQATFWVNRQNQRADELGVAVDASGKILDDLVAFLAPNNG